VVGGTHTPYIPQRTDRYDPGEAWVGDHCQLDFWVRAGKKMFRPWLTAWQDWKTRRIVGYTLAESPNSDTILSALRMFAQHNGCPGPRARPLAASRADARPVTVGWPGGRAKRRAAGRGGEDAGTCADGRPATPAQPDARTPHNPPAKAARREGANDRSPNPARGNDRHERRRNAGCHRASTRRSSCSLVERPPRHPVPLPQERLAEAHLMPTARRYRGGSPTRGDRGLERTPEARRGASIGLVFARQTVSDYPRPFLRPTGIRRAG